MPTNRLNYFCLDFVGLSVVRLLLFADTFSGQTIVCILCNAAHAVHNVHTLHDIIDMILPRSFYITWAWPSWPHRKYGHIWQYMAIFGHILIY